MYFSKISKAEKNLLAVNGKRIHFHSENLPINKSSKPNQQQKKVIYLLSYHDMALPEH